MKRNIGIVREVDELGRVVFPKEIRTVLGIAEGDPLEIFHDETAGIISLRKVSCRRMSVLQRYWKIAYV